MTMTVSSNNRPSLDAPSTISAGSMLKSREIVLIGLLILVFVGGDLSSPWFLDIYNLLDSTAIFSEIAMMALSTALVIICRDIDISMASVMALSSLMMGLASQSLGLGALPLCLVGLLTGAACGFFNGFLVTRLKMPAIVVTIGTMSLFRGVAAGVLGNEKIAHYPDAFAAIGQSYFMDMVPYSFITFVLLSIVFIIVIHYTTIGRSIFALGNNPEGALFSGIRTDRLRFILFTLNGLMAGLAAVFLTSRLGSTRPDIANGLEMEVITIVVLGGVSLNGGKGTISGVFIAALVIGFLRLAITLNNVPGNILIVFTGTLLVVSVALPIIGQKYLPRLSKKKSE
ncbi:rhamnose transport system permease protein [Cohaesibacter marisflavi]|uniref:Autoinducer 2 import system permease protein LsrD n=1 Tax=Cohaesibacter marisflavi TaxID=655353 RepID=A0A1I5LZ97_9HYPH|nr:ABC transporter permease [Cohaesibacter marisflavi]SFP02540.1 rhamnose transport system permease protein [Cohaesibacter marisflavi]